VAHYDITDFDGADIIDVRNVIARVEELREELQTAMDENEEGHNFTELASYVEAVRKDQSAAHAHRLWEEADELRKLEELLSDLCGYGGDEQWEGDWYPVTLIKDSYFEEYMDEMLEDIGDLPKNIPAYLKIVVDYDMLKQDYSEVYFEGNTYYYR
jgi:uncharacterized coiled-coil DUF342 family protein